MRATMTVDPRLLKLLGDKLYSNHPLPIVVRELLQNARDACVRRGVKPDIRIEINYESPNDCHVICEDNGIGMTQEEMVNDFLCLGNTSKAKDTNAVGGFGIAKAALMRNPEWSVHSLDNYFDNTYLLTGEEIKKVDHRFGTKIEVHITERVWENTFKQALLMIYGSDVDVHLKTTNTELVTFKDESAGWSLGQCIPMDNGVEWEGYRFDKTLFSQYGYEIEKTNLVRLNGLVQFYTITWEDRDFNLLFELKPICRPEDKDYPLTVSREELVGESRSQIMAFISLCNQNPLTMAKHDLSKPEDLTECLEGYLMRGKRTSVENFSDDISFPDGLPREMLVENHNDFTHQRLLLKDYDKSIRNVRADKKVLAVWRELIVECAEFADLFGIGLIISSHANAMREWHDGSNFYLINPDFGLGLGLEARIHAMHLLACHECAHYEHSSHGERHSSHELQIYLETIDIVIANMSRYKKAMR